MAHHFLKGDDIVAPHRVSDALKVVAPVLSFGILNDVVNEFHDGLFPDPVIDSRRRTIAKQLFSIPSESNTNSLHWPRLMHEMGLAEAFDHHFPSHLTGKIKPDKNAFETVLEKMRWRPRSVLFLDDNLPNVETAASLGIQAFHVRGLDEARAVLERARVLR